MFKVQVKCEVNSIFPAETVIETLIRLFNVNNPSVTIFIFLYVVVLNLILFIKPSFFAVPQTDAPLSLLFFYLTESLFNNNYYLLAVLTVFLVLVQSLMLNSLVNSAKLFETGSFVPSAIYITLTCLAREFMFLSPAMLSMTFIIPALGKSLRFFRQQRCYLEVYDMGFLIAIAALFYKPACVLIFLLFIALAVMRSFNWREWIIGLSGFVTVFFLTGTVYFMADRLPVFMSYITKPAIAPAGNFESTLSLSLLLGSTGILVATALLIFMFNFLKSAVAARKFFVLGGWALLLLSLSGLFVSKVTLHHFVVLSVPLSIVISYLFMNIKRVRIANIIHYVWVAIVLFFHYFNS